MYSEARTVGGRWEVFSFQQVLTTIEHWGGCEKEQPKVGPKGIQAVRVIARETAKGSPSGARRAGANESTLGVGTSESKDTESTEVGGWGIWFILGMRFTLQDFYTSEFS